MWFFNKKVAALFIPVLLIIILLGVYRPAFAACLTSQVVQSNCNNSNFDCSNNVGQFSGSGSDIAACASVYNGACGDVVMNIPGPPDYTTWCFASRSAPTSTPVPTTVPGSPTSTPIPVCGWPAGQSCCPAPNLCQYPLVPYTAGLSGTCVCVNPTTPIPTSGQPPTGPPAFLTQPPTSNPLNPSCNSGQGVNTALGCIPTGDLNDFASWVLTRAIGLAGGIAFLLMAFGAFKIITAGGDPNNVKAGSELISAALSGLLFIILSALLLKIIGVDILKLPDF